MRYFQEPTNENPVFPCGTCHKKVGNHHKATQCDLCNFWNHIKCDGIDNKTYENMKNNQQMNQHFCKTCKEEIFPFQSLTDELYNTSIVKNIDIETNENLNLKVTPSPTLKVLFNDIDKNDSESPINCNYYDYTDSIPNSKNKEHSMFHLNIASLGLHKEELLTSLSLINKNTDFDVVAVTETKIRTGMDPIYDLSLPGYQTPFQTPTECAKGGALLYIKDHIDCKRRVDLEQIMYKSRELESVEKCINSRRHYIFVFIMPPGNFFNK